MKDNLHELIFVLDQSTSIKEHYDSAVENLRKLITSQKKLSESANVTITAFGNDYIPVFDGKPISKVKFVKKLFPDSGVCPMIDSVMRTIDSVGERLSQTPEEERPSKVIVTIVTFGRDNASKKHTYDELAKKIQEQSGIYKWSFFLVTDFSINMEKLGIKEDNTIIIHRDDADTFKTAYAELDKKIAQIRNS